MGERGGWGLSRRRELKVNVCRHNGEGRPPPRQGERPVLEALLASALHDQYSAEACLVGAALPWKTRKQAAVSEGFEVFPGVTKDHGAVCSVQIPAADLTAASRAPRWLCFFCPTRSPPTLLVRRGRHPRCVFRLGPGASLVSPT